MHTGRVGCRTGRLCIVCNANSAAWHHCPPLPPPAPSARLVVVGGVGKGEGQQALLLQVGLVDAGKRLDDDGAGAQVARLQRGVLAGGALTCGGRLGVVPGWVRLEARVGFGKPAQPAVQE